MIYNKVRKSAYSNHILLVDMTIGIQIVKSSKEYIERINLYIYISCTY